MTEVLIVLALSSVTGLRACCPFLDINEGWLLILSEGAHPWILSELFLICQYGSFLTFSFFTKNDGFFDGRIVLKNEHKKKTDKIHDYIT